ncbi:AAA+ ATPase domain-containing protein [Candidatus Magnetomoraceae bacterium gMMP-13]
MKFFNTAGPVNCKKHYCLPPLERFNLDEILLLIDQEKYFILHAPRQTGKTSCMLALMDYLNKAGKYRCLYCNVEIAQGAREDVKSGMQAILNEISSESFDFLKDSFLKENFSAILKQSGENAALNEALTRWAEKSQKPLVILIDEIDSLIGDTLISVLRQLRAGYHKHPKLFPQSIILCGVRDVRDYRIHSNKNKAVITGGSAFNIKAESLRLGNFDLDEIKQLYNNHTEETGQKFNENIYPCVWELTGGQPWLVNALAYEVCFRIKEGKNRENPITLEMIKQAKENLIYRRETHLDQLSDKLKENRVQRVIEPILSGDDYPTDIPDDDIFYAKDLGLIKINGQMQIANKIYQEVIPRALTFSTQVNISQQTNWYVNEDGLLNMKKLLAAFQNFFRKHSDRWCADFQYREAAAQLLLQAFLQRIVNSGGMVEREYGLGKQRTDLFITWNYDGGVQEVVIELKIRYGNLEKTIKKGLEQTWKYMDKCGTNEGHLVIFDRSKNISWDEKIFCFKREFSGQKIMVWGM